LGQQHVIKFYYDPIWTNTTIGFSKCMKESSIAHSISSPSTI